jgi:hypothetical protein
MLAPMELPKSPLHRYLNDMLYALKGRAFYSSLALALTIPDICGSIDYPAEPSVGKRYRDWFTDWCWMLQSYMSAADCYALRCSYLHTAAEQFHGTAAPWADLSHIQFTSGQDRGVWATNYLPSPSESGQKPAVRMPIEDFCRGMATCADGWWTQRGSDPQVVAALNRLLEIRPYPQGDGAVME